MAFVILAPGAALDEAAALAHCRSRIARYKVPARLIRLDAFPVTQSANGTKIQRTRLRAMAEEAMRQETR
jgi:fatty-acyl-CoA synthase